MENNETMVPALERQAFMNQFLSMFLQFFTAWTSEPRPRPDIKFAQVGAIPEEVVKAVAASCYGYWDFYPHLYYICVLILSPVTPGRLDSTSIGFDPFRIIE